MATFDIQFAQGTPEVVRQPRANLNVDTGGQAIGNAVAGLGERLFQFGEKKQKTQNALDLSKQKRRYDEISLSTYNALQNVTDDDEAQKILSQYQADVGSLRTGNADVDGQFDIHINDTITGVTESFGKRLETNKIKKLNDEFDVNYQGLLSSGDYDGASELIGNMQSSGAITAVKAEGLRNTFVAGSYLQQAENKINLGNPASLESAGGMLDALSKQDKLKLTAEQLEKMDNLRTNLLSAKNRKGSADKLVAREQEFQLLEAMNNNTLTFDMLSKADQVDPTTLREMWSQYQNAQAEKSQNKISTIEEGDPIVNANMTATVDIHPELLDPHKIWQMTSKGLGTKTAASLVSRWNAAQDEKDPVSVKYRKQLAGVHAAGLFGKKDDVDTSDTYIKKTIELENFLKTSPTDEQAATFFSKLIREDVKKGLLGKLFGFGLKYGTPPIAAYRAYKESRTPAQGKSAPATTTKTSYRVQSQDGKVGTIPAEDLQEALSSGYKVIE